MDNKQRIGSGNTNESRLLQSGLVITVVKIFGWISLAFISIFIMNNFFALWLELPGALTFQNTENNLISLLQTGFYGFAIIAVFGFVYCNREQSIRVDSQRVLKFNSFLIRVAFWTVLLIGLVDVSISFLLSEQLLHQLVSEAHVSEFRKAEFRATYVHLPLTILSVLIALTTRSIGIIWLPLLVVAAELLIVVTRFIFSYEQVFMTDLVRFWYAPLFLFGCAYTLRKEGHVRVDVFYAVLSKKNKGLLNAIGTVLFGMPFCWLLLYIGMSGKTGVINSALLNFEIEGLGDGMHVLYIMTIFMGVFAIIMLVEFVGYLFDAVADYCEEPAAEG